ncbi:hypothetical protein [Sanguibacter massiliensis]|uniref:hypothetical protein n=1 Tax=Sanguibacter massiliensis TaxID=1973217 RepID=UPI001A90EE51|nr:hypothetical protein [Sanguibacter massiliensis]
MSSEYPTGAPDPHAQGGYPAPGPTPGPVDPAQVYPQAQAQAQPQAGQYAQPGYAQPGPAQAQYAQPGYAQPGPAQAQYAQPGYAQPGPAQAQYAQPGYPQQAYAQPHAGYPQPDPAQAHAPYAQQPGYGQPGYGQPGYGQPGYGQVPAAGTLPPMAPTGMAVTMKGFLDIPRLVWQGDTDGALAHGRSFAGLTGKPWLWPLVVFLGWGLVGSLLAIGFVNRTLRATTNLFGSFMNGITGGYSSYSPDVSIPAGMVFGMLLAGLVLAVAMGALRAATLGWALRTRQVAVPFWTTANLAATAYAPFVIIFLGYALLNLIPSLAWGGLLTIVGTPMMIMYVVITEIMLYTGLVQLAPGASKSLLVPHAACLVAFSVLAGLGLIVLSLLFS